MHLRPRACTTRRAGALHCARPIPMPVGIKKSSGASRPYVHPWIAHVRTKGIGALGLPSSPAARLPQPPAVPPYFDGSTRARRPHLHALYAGETARPTQIAAKCWALVTLLSPTPARHPFDRRLPRGFPRGVNERLPASAAALSGDPSRAYSSRSSPLRETVLTRLTRVNLLSDSTRLRARPPNGRHNGGVEHGAAALPVEGRCRAQAHLPYRPQASTAPDADPGE